MRKVKTAAVQMRCEKQVQDNIAHAEELVRKAAAEGAQIILLPELFERPYFCQERRYEYYQYAKPVMENEAVRRFRQVARELSVVLPVSFYERDRNLLFNSVAVLDADGSILGIYRKTHIPDDHYYQEKFYFTPGDTGFRVFETRYDGEVDMASKQISFWEGENARISFLVAQPLRREGYYRYMEVTYIPEEMDDVYGEMIAELREACDLELPELPKF